MVTLRNGKSTDKPNTVGLHHGAPPSGGAPPHNTGDRHKIHDLRTYTPCLCGSPFPPYILWIL